VKERLDILLYAHDGRGIGHAGRMAAIGLALRRLYPSLRVALVTGERRVESLLRGGPLDWLKLPSYATRVVDGRSAGAPGPSGLSDKALGELRAELLCDVVRRFAPRLVLADHTPQGKHRELLPAIEESRACGTRWVLGVRAVVGGVDKVWSELAADLFRSRYHGLFWYGDTALCTDEAARLATHFGRSPQALGYVSRLHELEASGLLGQPLRHGSVAAGLSWHDGETAALLSAMAGAAGSGAPWRVWSDFGPDGKRAYGAGLALNDFGEGWLDDLRGARAAVVYGGYNSLTDVLASGIPAVVLLRGMQDAEQEAHASALCAIRPGLQVLAAPEVDAVRLAAAVEEVAAMSAPLSSPVDLGGAANAAHALAAMLEEESA